VIVEFISIPKTQSGFLPQQKSFKYGFWLLLVVEVLVIGVLIGLYMS
jgi:heme/copper-type cytochrome/quinol oxidase subunit 3